MPSARYVDDIYVFAKNVDEADKMLRELIPFLRTYDLVLNEAKCVIIPKASLITEEPDLEGLFNDAVKEIAGQVEDDDFDADYGFQSEWVDEEAEEGVAAEKQQDTKGDLELKATENLFDSLKTYSGHEESIERFCLPLFTKANSSYAVEHVMDAFKKRPAMSQIYSSYLAKFLTEEKVIDFLVDLLTDELLSDWQKMWIIAALLQVTPSNDSAIKITLNLFKDANRHDALRAVAAIYVGRYGDLDRRKSLNAMYAKVSNYVQAAIYYSTRYWKGIEKSNAKTSWGGHGILNVLLTEAFAIKSD
jgi:hypothetical protein